MNRKHYTQLTIHKKRHRGLRGFSALAFASDFGGSSHFVFGVTEVHEDNVCSGRLVPGCSRIYVALSSQSEQLTTSGVSQSQWDPQERAQGTAYGLINVVLRERSSVSVRERPIDFYSNSLRTVLMSYRVGGGTALQQLRGSFDRCLTQESFTKQSL